MKKYYLLALVIGITLAVGKNTFLKPQESRAVASSSGKAYPGAFQIHITSRNVNNSPTVFKLQANIRGRNAEGAFEFQWHLPAGVKVIAGEIDPTLNFEANGAVQTEIIIEVPNSLNNYQITAEAYRVRNEENVQGAVAQFNTNPQTLTEQQLPLPKSKKGRILQ